MPDTYKAHYWRHYREQWEDLDSVADAVEFLSSGEEMGELSAVSVVLPDGTDLAYDWVNKTLGGRPVDDVIAEHGTRPDTVDKPTTLAQALDRIAYLEALIERREQAMRDAITTLETEIP